MDLRVWIGQGPTPKNALSQASADAACGTPTVDLSRDFEDSAQRKLQIHRARPAVDAPSESPKLPAVISSCADRKLLSTNASGPRKSCRVRWLARIFTPAGISFVRSEEH